MVEKVKISAVAYTNTKPFIYGLSHSAIINQIDLSLDVPADCARKLIDGRVDIGLIPVAAIPLVPNAQIISDYCIGSVGAVNSVFIFSNVPVQQIRTLRLDPQSQTSNNLAKVLLKNHFKVNVDFTTDESRETDACVLIGDRTFGRKTEFAYVYDMGQEWMNFTGLPFMYAAWVANKPINDVFIKEFNAALAYGVSHISTVVKELSPVIGIDIDDYLTHKLDFKLDAEKLKAKDLFLKLITAR